MDAPRHHMVIGGTGRAGTSFLVKFLAACGFDVDLGQWHDRARAGLEQSLLDATSYVVKDPWLFTYFDDIDLGDVIIDVLIIPMRDLREAAISRLLQERIHMVEGGWHLRPLTDVWGSTPGGALYSLNPLDQERLLGVGFYRLVRWALTNEIPLLFLDFPRIVEDGDYLVDGLTPWLGGHCSVEEAHEVFAKIADSSAIRVDSPDGDDPHTDDAIDPELLTAAKLEREALAAFLEERKEAERLRVAALEEDLARAMQHEADGKTRLRDQSRELEELKIQLHRTEEALAETTELLADERHEREAIRRSLSWRLTRPLRAIGALSLANGLRKYKRRTR